jgi:hypothetical protein
MRQFRIGICAPRTSFVTGPAAAKGSTRSAAAIIAQPISQKAETLWIVTPSGAPIAMPPNVATPFQEMMRALCIGPTRPIAQPIAPVLTPLSPAPRNSCPISSKVRLIAGWADSSPPRVVNRPLTAQQPRPRITICFEPTVSVMRPTGARVTKVARYWTLTESPASTEL